MAAAKGGAGPNAGAWMAGAQAVVAISAAFDAKRVAKAEYKAAKMMQEANNRLAGARAAAYARLQAVNNRRILDNGGAEVTTISVNRARLMDASTQGSIQQQIQASEQLGAFSVAASAAGQGGRSVQLIKQQMLKSVAESVARREVQVGQQVGDMSEAQGDALKGAILSQDYSYNPATLDYTAHMKPSNAGIWNAALEGATKTGSALPGKGKPATAEAGAEPTMTNSYRGQTYAGARTIPAFNTGVGSVIIK